MEWIIGIIIGIIIGYFLYHKEADIEPPHP